MRGLNIPGPVLGLLLASPGIGLAQVAAPPAPRTIVEAPDRFFTRAEVRLRYREAGRGEPVVLLHGYTQRIELMRDLADSLSANHRVIVLDQRGFGESAKLSDPARYGRAMVDDVIGLLDQLGIRRAHLVGHSMGALIAAVAAVRHPDRVASATLVAGPFFADSAAFAGMSTPFVQALERGEGMVAFGKWLFPGIPDSIARVTSDQVMGINDVSSLVASLRAMGGLMVPPGGKPGSSTAVLIVVGTGDPLLPQSQALWKLWPTARYVELPGVNHDAVRAHGGTVAAIRGVIRPM